MTEETMRMKANRPGTRKIDDLRSGLYQTRGAASSGERNSIPNTSGVVAATIWRA